MKVNKFLSEYICGITGVPGRNPIWDRERRDDQTDTAGNRVSSVYAERGVNPCGRLLLTGTGIAAKAGTVRFTEIPSAHRNC